MIESLERAYSCFRLDEAFTSFFGRNVYRALRGIQLNKADRVRGAFRFARETFITREAFRTADKDIPARCYPAQLSPREVNRFG